MILRDGEIMLRTLHIDDADILSKLANNRRIWDNVRDYLPHPYSKEDALKFISSCSREITQTTFAITYQNQMVGVIGLILQTDVYRLSAEVGYWIGEPFWNKGIASKAVKLVVEYCFEQLGLIRVFAGTFDFNKASQKVLENAGFHKEAILKNAVIKNGRICDEYRYAILKE